MSLYSLGRMLTADETKTKLYAAIKLPMTRHVMRWERTGDEKRACEAWIRNWRLRQQGGGPSEGSDASA